VVNWDDPENLEYGDRMDFMDQMFNLLRESTQISIDVIHMIVNYAVPKGRYNPVQIPGAYQALMREALVECKSFDFVGHRLSTLRS
jgi:hypothetical protein